jgi:micrococcal nuclease
MSNITFVEDFSSRKVTQFLLLSQIAGAGIVLGFRFFHLFYLAFIVSLLTLMLLIISLLWLYARYRDLPMIREKRDLKHLVLKFQKGVQKEGSLIQSAVKEHELLLEAEKEEIGLRLSRLQKNHIEHGLAASSVQEAEIPGMDLKLQKQLAEHGILSATEVTERMAVPELEEPQRQALLDWRRSVMGKLVSTTPMSLNESQLESIQLTYQALHAKNDALHRKARASKQLLEHEILSFKARLRELAPLTFLRYLSLSLASHGVLAALIALMLIVTQGFSSISATRSMTMDSLPPASPSPVITHSAPAVLPPTETMPPVTVPALTDTPAILATPSSPSPLPLSSTASPVATLTTPQVALPAGIPACIPQNTARETGLVVSIVDGDTIEVRINDRDVRVRYIGVDTPEHDQALYAEATAYNQKLVENKTVTLVKDTSDVDPFNRLLRYVIVGDTFVNNELVAMGYAQAAAYPPDTACLSTFETAQRKAQLVKVGLWMPTPEIYIPAVTGGDTALCDPSYPGVCIPPAPPDLNCGDVQYRRFQVLPPDPHGFDRDGDGVGCES